MKKLLKRVICLLLVVCMCLPMTVLAAETYYLKISIREEANPDKIVRSESVGYLLESEPLAPLVVAALNERYNDGSLAWVFRSGAMRDIMLDGLHAYGRISNDGGAAWADYLDIYFDKVSNLDESLTLKELLVDPDSTIGDLKKDQVYEMKFKNDVIGDSKYGTVYIVSVERKSYSAGHDCPSELYSDLDTTQWYHESVDFVLERGIMNGVGNGRFNPHGPTTRAMIVTMLYRLEGQPAVGDVIPFTDVKSNYWYTDAIIWGEANGIVEGYGNGEFGPDDVITREQMAKIMHCYADYKGYDVTAQASLDSFSDADLVSFWAVERMQWAVSVELINGMGNGALQPQGNAERCQVAAIFMRFFKEYID